MTTKTTKNQTDTVDLDAVSNLLNVTQQGGETVAEIYIYERIATRWWGGFSPDTFRALVDEAGEVDRYVLRILSEGGSTIGGNALASEIRRLDKPTRAEVEVAMSAATIVALECDEVVIAENGWWMVHHAAAESYEPLKATELRALAERLDTINGQLTDRYLAVSSLDAEQLAELMDSERWLSGAEAVEAGFCTKTVSPVSTLGEFEPLNLTAEKQREALRSLSAAFHKSPQGEPHVKTDTTTTAPSAATLVEIKAAAPGCSNDFAVSQMEASATLEQVSTAWLKQQTDELAALKATNESLTAKVDELETSAAAKPEPKPAPGSDPINEGSDSGPATDSTDPIAAWGSLLTAKCASGLSRQKAVRSLVRENPTAHAAYLAAVQS
jgi:ATP-dependent Clp protease protease subunit